jgi:hypothetical protein
MATHTFNVGDRVRISKDSKYCGKSDRNPADVIGTVEQVGEIAGPFIYRVLWDTAEYNSYREGDLVPAKENTKAGLVTVSTEFVLEAYTAACPEWKKKIKIVVPDLYTLMVKVPKSFIREAYEAADSEWKKKLEDNFGFLKGPEYARIVEEGSYQTEVYYRANGGVLKDMNGINILHGLAGTNGIPKSAQGCGFYISSNAFAGKDVKVVVKEIGSGTVIYFEKK